MQLTTSKCTTRLEIQSLTNVIDNSIFHHMKIAFSYCWRMSWKMNEFLMHSGWKIQEKGRKKIVWLVPILNNTLLVGQRESTALGETHKKSEIWQSFKGVERRMLATAFAYDFHGDCLLSPTDMLLLIGNKRTTSTIVLPDFYQFFPPFFPNNTAVAESFSLFFYAFHFNIRRKSHFRGTHILLRIVVVAILSLHVSCMLRPLIKLFLFSKDTQRKEHMWGGGEETKKEAICCLLTIGL